MCMTLLTGLISTAASGGGKVGKYHILELSPLKIAIFANSKFKILEESL